MARKSDPKPKRKRPGMPRKQAAVRRITLRLAMPIADDLIAACTKNHITQRDFIEEAVKEYCSAPTNGDSEQGLPHVPIYRSGMWVDPAVVAMMDQREEEEGISQRALLERAIVRKLRAAK